MEHKNKYAPFKNKMRTTHTLEQRRLTVHVTVTDFLDEYWTASYDMC